MNVRNLEKIQDKWLLFQRFVTSIEGVAQNLSNALESDDPLSRLARRNFASLQNRAKSHRSYT